MAMKNNKNNEEPLTFLIFKYKQERVQSIYTPKLKYLFLTCMFEIIPVFPNTTYSDYLKGEVAEQPKTFFSKEPKTKPK